MTQTKICRYCGNVIYKEEQTCEYCGKYLNKEPDNDELFCEKCKSPVNTDDNFCQKCGAVFNLPDEDLNDLSIKHNIMGIPYNIGIFLTSLALGFALTVYIASGKVMTAGDYFVYYCAAFIVSEIFLYIYFLPSIIAIENNNSNACLIYICNLLMGATIIGWIVSLSLALKLKQQSK